MKHLLKKNHKILIKQKPIDLLKPSDAVSVLDIERVLIVKFRNLGDVLLTTPVLTVLKRELQSGSRVDVLVYDDCKPILLENRDVTNIYTVQRKKPGLVKSIARDINQWLKLRAHNYDLVINLTEGDRGALVSLFSGAKYRVGLEHKNSSNSWWKRQAYTHLYRTDLGKRPAVEQGLDALRRIGFNIKYQTEAATLNISKIEREQAVSNLKQANWKGKKYVVFHPTSRWLFKCITPQQSAEIMHSLIEYGFEIVMTAGPDRRENLMINNILSEYSGDVVNLADKLSLRELAAVIKNATIIVGADSVPIHMAAALNTPSLVWFGPSNEKVWGPWMAKHQIVSLDYSCRPCGVDGCGGGKRSECLINIDRNDFIAAIENLIKGVA
jgi:heptosyltransferase-3